MKVINSLQCTQRYVRVVCVCVCVCVFFSFVPSNNALKMFDVFTSIALSHVQIGSHLPKVMLWCEREIPLYAKNGISEGAYLNDCRISLLQSASPSVGTLYVVTH
jgi:hypothetical protein